MATHFSTKDIAVTAIAAGLIAAGTWLTGMAVDANDRVGQLEATTTIELRQINATLDRHEAKLDRLLERTP